VSTNPLEPFSDGVLAVAIRPLVLDITVPPTGGDHLGHKLALTIGVIPFATALLAEYLKEGQGENLAAAVYGGSFLAMAVAFATLHWHILFRRRTCSLRS
jgi:uncharacterized membrane protein